MSHNTLEALYSDESLTPDPGDGGDIGQSKGIEVVDITTAAAETRTLKDPSRAGNLLTLRMFEDGGDCVITAETAINQAGNTTITLDAVGEAAFLQSVTVAGSSPPTYRYQVVAVDGATLGS